MKKNSIKDEQNKCTCSAIQKCDIHRKSRLAQTSSSLEKPAQQEQKNVKKSNTIKKEAKK